MTDRVTEDEISVILHRIRSTPTGEVNETVAFKPELGETMAAFTQRVLAPSHPFMEGLMRSHTNRMEVRLIQGRPVPEEPS